MPAASRTGPYCVLKYLDSLALSRPLASCYSPAYFLFSLQVLLSLTPLWAVLLSRDDSMGPTAWAGGAVVILAGLLSSFARPAPAAAAAAATSGGGVETGSKDVRRFNQ